jgi:hypothetical protein
MAATATTSRKERRRAERQRRKEQLHQEQGQQQKTAQARKLGGYGLALLLMIGLGYWGYGKWTQQPIGEFVASLGNQHITQAEVGLITYNSDPPTSGPHFPNLARWGIHDKPIPKELQVHNLEDGGVLVQYSCDQAAPDCRSLVEKLSKIVELYGHAILAPYPGMSHKIALTAWSRIDKFDDFDEKRIRTFIESYMGIDHHAAKR